MRADSVFKDERGVVVALETILIFAILSIFMVTVYLAVNNLNTDTREEVVEEELTAIGYEVAREITNMNAEIDSSFSLSHELSYQKTLRIPRTAGDLPYSITINSSRVVLETVSLPHVRVVIPMRRNLPVYETTIYSTSGQPVLAFHDQSGMLYFSTNLTHTPPIDDIAPSVNITAPINGSTVSNTTTITTTATDNVAVTKVEYYVDGILNATKTTSYDWNWDTTTLTNGNHTVTARAYDRVFQFSEDTHIYKVNNSDSTPPSIYDLTPADGSTVYGYANSTQKLTIQASYSDLSGIDTSATTISFNGTYVTNDTDTTITSSYVKYQRTYGSLTNNSNYPVNVTACDTNNRCNTESWSFTYGALEDVTAPNLSITAPLATSTHNHGETITATFDVWDNESGIDYVMVNITNSSGARVTDSEERIEFSGETTEQSSQTWTCTCSYDSEQVPYNITLRAYNMNDNSTTEYVSGLEVAGNPLVVTYVKVHGGKKNKVRSYIKNNGSNLLTLDQMRYTWTTPGAGLKKLKVKDYYAMPPKDLTLWSGGPVSSNTTVDVVNIDLDAGVTRKFEAEFNDTDMRGVSFNITLIMDDTNEYMVSFTT